MLNLKALSDSFVIVVFYLIAIEMGRLRIYNQTIYCVLYYISCTESSFICTMAGQQNTSYLVFLTIALGRFFCKKYNLNYCVVVFEFRNVPP